MLRNLMLGCIFIVSMVPNVAQAQVYPVRPVPVNPYNPYVNPYYPPGRGYNQGAYLSGAAQVMQGYGDVVVKQEEARVVREKANQAKIDTKRKAFDEMLYEKAHTPTYAEELSETKRNTLIRLMNHPMKGEITNGTTLNYMLPYLEALTSQGSMGPPVPLSQSTINRINISTGGSKSSVGMLRSPLEWPIGLKGPNQKALDKLIPKAVDSVVDGDLTLEQMKQIRTEMKQMRETLARKCRNDEIETSTYMQALSFYNSLDSSLSALERPDAKKQLSGAMSPRARNVQELVDFMIDNGLTFAAASPGDESSYQIAHDAFVRFARNAEASNGFQSLQAPVASAGAKKK